MTDLHPNSETAPSDRPKPDPDRDYAGNEAATEPPPADPDKTQPTDPPANPDSCFGQSEAAEETPQADPDKNQPWEPPPLEAAEKNGR